MVFDFTPIRSHLQQNVLQKLDFIDFSRFSQCSHYSKAISECLKARLSHEMLKVELREDEFKVETLRGFVLPISRILDQFPVRIHINRFVNRASFVNRGKISKERWNQIIRLFESGKIKTRKIEICRGEEWMEELSPETFNRLLKVSQIQEFVLYAKTTIDYLLQPELKKIPRMNLYTFVPAPLGIFLYFKAEILRPNSVIFNPQSANEFLKQWYEGIRKIEVFSLGCTETIDNVQDEAIFSGIPHELIWSMEFHPQSVVSQIPIGQMESREGLRIFVLKRGNEQLLVHIENNNFWAQMTSGPEADVRKELGVYD